MRLFITGASGFIGAKLCRTLATTWQLIGTYRTGLERLPPGVTAVALDVCDARAVTAALEQAKPDAIVHAAAVAEFNRCARDPGAAAACNADGTRHVARYASRARIPMLYLSTDLVFDGLRGGYADHDVPAPACVYGATKYAGEQSALAENPDTCIVRLALTYGATVNGRPCFLERMLDALRRGEQVRLFVDEYRTPVLLDDLCATVERVLAAAPKGVFHVASACRLSRYELGVLAAQAFGLPLDGIVPAARASASPERPADCSMLASVALTELGCQHRDPAQGLSHLAASVGTERGSATTR